MVCYKARISLEQGFVVIKSEDFVNGVRVANIQCLTRGPLSVRNFITGLLRGTVSVFEVSQARSAAIASVRHRNSSKNLLC